MSENSWLSIITVVKDDLPGLQRTEASIAGQKVHGVEWIVVDGSTSASNASKALEHSPIAPHLIYQEPRGIYAAMNAGIAAATGTYAYFLNAGDTFAGPEVLTSLRGEVEASDPDWLFGPVMIVDVTGRVTRTPAWNYATERKYLFSRGKFPSHQGTIAKRDVLASLGGFDTSYRIAADYAMALRLSLMSQPVVVSFPIAQFVEGGISTTEWQHSFREFHRARVEVFKPTGAQRLVEYANTGLHFARVFAHRRLGLRSRRSAE